jgi:hypothetical protein
VRWLIFESFLEIQVEKQRSEFPMKALVRLLIFFSLSSAAAFAQTPNGGYGPNGGTSGLAFVAALPGTCTPGVTASVQLSVTPFTVNYCSATNTWTALGAATGSVTATAGQTPVISALNAITGGTVVLDMVGIAGADLGAKMNACATALPAAGGTCLGNNLAGAQTLSTAVTTAKAVVYAFCGQAISQTAAISLASLNASIIGCPGANTIITKAASIDQITTSSTNNVVSGLTLVGVGGSFTGNGIVANSSSINTLITGNSLSGEAGQEISCASATCVISQNPSISHTAATTAVKLTGAGGLVIGNPNIVSQAGHGIEITGNVINVTNNFVTLNIGSGSAVSGLCAIIADGDQIGDRIINNQTAVNDNHATDTNYGICIQPSGTHNLNMLVSGNSHFGTLSGGAAAVSDWLNNVNNLNTNWGITFRDEACVHMNFLFKRTDTQSNSTRYLNPDPSDCALDNGTGSSNDIFEIQRSVSFASLPTPAGVGSYVSDCLGCGYGLVAPGSGASAPAHIVAAANLWQIQGPGAPSVFAAAYTNATTTLSNIAGLAIPIAASQNYQIHCAIFYQGSATTAGLDIAVTGPAGATLMSYDYKQWGAAGAIPLESTTFSFGTKLTGSATVGTSVHLAEIDINDSNGATAGTIQIQGAADGAGTVTVYQTSACYQH